MLKIKIILLLSMSWVWADKIPFVQLPDPKTNSVAYVLMDADTGQVIASKEPDKPHKPASLNKIMTAYVAFYDLKQQHISLEDEVLISENAWKTGGSKSFIKVGDKVPLEILLKGLIVQSGNDSAVAIAEYIAGDEGAFADLMNQHAQILGMDNTYFANASGLPDERQITTALDMAKLSKALIETFPEFYVWYSLKSFTYNDITQPNRNKLLWKDEGIDGIKTGYTSLADYNLVSSKIKDGMRLISVTLGAESEEKRFADAWQLLNFGFRFFEKTPLTVANQKLAEFDIGGKNTLQVGTAHDQFYLLRKEQVGNIKPNITIDTTLQLPISAQTVIGRVDFSFNDEVLFSTEAVALNDVHKQSFFGSITSFFKRLF